MADRNELASVCEQFCIEGDFEEGVPYGTGHINDTYAIRIRRGAESARYILQRINHNVFRDVPALMANIGRVTEHLRRKISALPGHDPDRETLTVIPTTGGDAYYRDENGDHWRTYIFIEGARTYDQLESPEQAFEAARAFGLFQKRLMDLPGPRLTETIPGFHHTPTRLQQLQEVCEKDPLNRAVDAEPEIQFAMDRAGMAPTLTNLLDAGELQERITHNDTKINNVMLDDRTGEGICVIDLDTVMPGLVLYDFGDQVRTTTCTGSEDETDLGRVRFQPHRFEMIVRGYLQAAADFLTATELDYLAFSGRLITFEIGIRFLTDFIAGDVYFKTHRPNHNLERARVQFERLQQMERLAPEMERIVASHRQ